MSNSFKGTWEGPEGITPKLKRYTRQGDVLRVPEDIPHALAERLIKEGLLKRVEGKSGKAAVTSEVV